MSGWLPQQYDHIDYIEKVFTFKKYSCALAFCNAVAYLAETNRHHPRIVIEWGRVKVAWGTHESSEGRGIMPQDKVLAEYCDELFSKMNRFL